MNRGEIMAYYGQEAIYEVREATDIVDLIGEYLVLKQKGKHHVALCPFHNEKTPSFSVNREKQIYYCFGCQNGGDVFQFLMEYEHLDFTEALEKLADRAGIELIPQKSGIKDQVKDNLSIEINLEAARYFYACFSEPMGKEALSYLVERGVEPESRKKFKIGYAPEGWDALLDYFLEKNYLPIDLQKAGLVNQSENNNKYYSRFRHRLIFPIENRKGDIIGFGGRSIDAREPKYLNSPETLHFQKKLNLYGINLALREIRRTSTALLMEGYMDVIMSHQYGFTNAVASLGTAFTTEQARLLSRYADDVILVYDGDEAGQKATIKAAKAFESFDTSVRVARLGKDTDPDDYIIKNGAEAFEQLLRHALPFYEHLLSQGIASSNLDDIEQKVTLTQTLIPYLSRMKNAIKQTEYIKLTAERLEISQQSLLFEVKKYRDEDKLEERKERRRIEKREEIKEKIKAKKNIGESEWGERAEKNLINLCLRSPELFYQIQGALAECPLQGVLSRKCVHLLSQNSDKNALAHSLLDQLEADERRGALSLMMDESSPLNEDTAVALMRVIKESNVRKKMNKLIKKIDLLEKEGKTDEVLEIEKEFQALQNQLNRL